MGQVIAYDSWLERDYQRQCKNEEEFTRLVEKVGDDLYKALLEDISDQKGLIKWLREYARGLEKDMTDIT